MLELATIDTLGIEVLGEEVIHESGSYKRVRRWLRGWHPKLGVLTWGWAGRETVAELDIVKLTYY